MNDTVKPPGPIATRVAQAMIDFQDKHGRPAKEIGLGFNLHVRLQHELGIPLENDITEFLGVRVTQPIDMPTEGCALR